MVPGGTGTATALPVSTREFYGLWNRIFSDWRVRAPPRRIALAVSGGSDSMALAYLCSKLASERLVPGLEVKAFIVNHQARPESKEEAWKVEGWLDALGIQSEILKLRWPKGSRKDQFETLARNLRYRALGTACIKSHTRDLFLGHHHDDNIETILLRLPQGHTMDGLRGFEEVSPIPENQGRYRISKSGGKMSFRSIHHNDSPAMEPEDERQESKPPYQVYPQPFIATGGVHLYRPFRTLTKPRLVATCREAGVPFVTDQTNFDPTLTPRNAIRRLLASDDLPQALRSESLSRLIQKSRDKISEELEFSNAFLRSCKILDFDLRTSNLVVQFPSPQKLDSIRATTEAGFRTVGDITKVQALTLRRFNRLISTTPTKELRSFANAASTVFPQPGSNAFQGPENPPPEIFTLGDVHWTPAKLQMRSTAVPMAHNYTQRSQASLASNHEDAEPNIWHLSRRLPKKNSPPPTVKLRLRIPNFSSGDGDLFSGWTDWQLWDDRYWVSVRAERVTSNEKIGTSPPTDQNETFPAVIIPLTMRFVEPRDLAAIQQHLKESGSHVQVSRSMSDVTNNMFPDGKWQPGFLTCSQYKDMLRRIVPNDRRYTLPILSGPVPADISLSQPPETSSEEDKAEYLYGLPSIHTALPGLLRMQHPKPVDDDGEYADTSTPTYGEYKDTAGPQGPVSYWRLRWRIKYREIDSDMIRLTGYMPGEGLQKRRGSAPKTKQPKPRSEIRNVSLFRNDETS